MIGLGRVGLDSGSKGPLGVPSLSATSGHPRASGTSASVVHLDMFDEATQRLLVAHEFRGADELI